MSSPVRAEDALVMDAYDTLYCPNDDVYMWAVKRTKRDQVAALAFLAELGYSIDPDDIVDAELD